MVRPLVTLDFDGTLAAHPFARVVVLALYALVPDAATAEAYGAASGDGRRTSARSRTFSAPTTGMRS